jgi:serine/threonine protein phosphatase PrpC
MDNGDTFFIHLADSRAIWMDDFGYLRYTIDHKPDTPEETQRIENAGGNVWHPYGGIARVDGILAVSRAFGDFDFKQPEMPQDHISVIPTITSNQGQPFKISHSGAFVLIASDGLWGSVSNDAAATFIRQNFDDPNLCNHLVNMVHPSETDDISIALFYVM